MYLFLWTFWSDVERSVVRSQADRPEQDDENWGVEQDLVENFVFTRNAKYMCDTIYKHNKQGQYNTIWNLCIPLMPIP